MPGVSARPEPDPAVPGRRPSYRTAGLLAALVLLGWAADLALGGRHTFGWLLALLLVAGIPALAAWSARRGTATPVHGAATPVHGAATPVHGAVQPVHGAVQPVHGAVQPVHGAVQPAPDQRPPIEPSNPDRVIRPARPDELTELIEIERAADRLFPLAGYGPTPPPATEEDLRTAAAVLVSGDPPAGYTRIEVVDGRAHLEGLSVRPRFMRQGRGSELVEAACGWAAAHGHPEITLCTFAEVPWNGPFYTKLGFTELTELTPGLRERRAAEGAMGLDGMGRRVVLIRRTETSPGPLTYLPID